MELCSESSVVPLFGLGGGSSVGLAACLARVSQAEPIKAEFLQVLSLVPKIILLHLC